MYAVGHRTLAFEDPSRSSWTGAGPRPLPTELWYPAGDDVEVEELRFGEPEPLFRLAPVARDAPWHPRAKPSPLIVLSHGTGGSALQMGSLARHLSMHGYACAAVNHHGNNSLEPFLPQGFLLWWERALDLSALLDALLCHRDVAERITAIHAQVAGMAHEFFARHLETDP